MTIACDEIAKSRLVRMLPESRSLIIVAVKASDKSNRCSNNVSDTGTLRSSIIALSNFSPSLMSLFVTNIVDVSLN